MVLGQTGRFAAIRVTPVRWCADAARRTGAGTRQLGALPRSVVQRYRDSTPGLHSRIGPGRTRQHPTGTLPIRVARGRVSSVGAPVEIRNLARDELSRVGEIDRTERIDALFEQHGTELVVRRGTWNAAAWDPDGHGEHSVHAQYRALERYVDAGGIVRGAFSHRRLVGIGVVVPHLRPAVAQLAYLHVSQEFRAAGIGTRLSADLERIAQRAGDTAIVVTATPSENTVRFYLGRGYRPMEQPLAELFELEPDDIHMSKAL